MNAFVDEYIALYAVLNGFYVGMQASDILDFEPILLEKIHLDYPDIIDEIENAKGSLSSDVLKILDEVIKEEITAFIEEKTKQGPSK